MSKLSVIVAVTGEVAAALGEQLESLSQQDYRGQWELLIADNGMSANTGRAIDRLAADWAHVALVIVDATDRVGKSYAVNAAVEAATGSHLVLLDSDDKVNSDYLTRLASAMNRDDFVGARLDSRSLNPAWLRARRKPLQEAGVETLLGHVPAVVGAGMAMSRDAYLEVGGFDEELSTQVDIDLSWRLFEAGYRPKFVADAVVQYRYRQDLKGVFRQERAYGRGEVALYVKHRAVVPRRHWRRTWFSWAGVIAAVPTSCTKAGRAKLVTRAGAALGRIEGSMRHRVRYL